MSLEDEEVARAMERAFRKQRIGVMTSTTVKKVTVEDDRCKVEVEGKKGVETLTAEVTSWVPVPWLPLVGSVVPQWALWLVL